MNRETGASRREIARRQRVGATIRKEGEQKFLMILGNVPQNNIHESPIEIVANEIRRVIFPEYKIPQGASS